MSVRRAAGGDVGTVEADIAEIDAAGRAMLTVSDDLEELARHEVLMGRGVYGDDALAGAAGRFAQRFGHLTRTLSSQAEHAGVALRRTGVTYGEREVLAPARFDRLAEQLPPGQALT